MTTLQWVIVAVSGEFVLALGVGALMGLNDHAPLRAL
jgi:hypothetical protein